VGDVIRKVVLVDVDADAGDGVLEAVATDCVLDEDAGNLFPVNIYVVI